MLIKLTTNVMFGGQHHAAGEIVDVEAAVAKQILDQGLGEKSSKADSGAGPATSEPEPQGKEQAQSGPRAAKQGK